MSHVVAIETEMTDIEAIKDACRALGLHFKENQKTYRWFGKSVGDYPIPHGMTVADLGKCSHAIGVAGTPWEIGLVRPKGAKGFFPVFDFFGMQGQPIARAVGGNDAKLFVQAYAVAKATREAKRRGYRVQQRKAKNGKVQLIITGC